MESKKHHTKEFRNDSAKEWNLQHTKFDVCFLMIYKYLIIFKAKH